MVRFQVETIPLGQELSLEEEESFLNSTVEYFRSMGVDMIIPGTFSSVFRTYPKGAAAAPYGSYVVDLSRSEKILWDNVHSKHRNQIRSAIRKGVKIRDGCEQIDRVDSLVKDSFRRSTTGLVNIVRLGIRMKGDPIRRQALNLGDHVKILVAEHNGKVQGCAVIPFSNYSAYYMHGGSISECTAGAMNLLQWEAMCFFRNLGVRYYNFVGARIDPEPGSKQQGLSMFKRRFGGELKRGYMWKYSFHPLKNRLYSIANRCRSGGDIVDQEEHKLESV